jgi:hypothetical protein
VAKKKKKKKRPSGAKKPTYAKGKKVEEPQKKAAPAAGKSTSGTQARPRGSQSKAGAREGTRPEAQQWNLVRKDTLEAKVMYFLLAVIAVAALLSYPLVAAEYDAQYKTALKEYPQALKEWEQKNPTAAEKKKNEKEKPAKPVKQSGNVVLINMLFPALQSAIFAFLALNILRRTDLGTPVLDKGLSGGQIRAPDLQPFLVWSVPAALVMLAPMYAADRMSSKIGEIINNAAKTTFVTSGYPVWKASLGSISVGLFVGIMFVMLGVSAFVWLFTRYRGQTRVEPHWAGIASAFAMLFVFNVLNASSAVRSAPTRVNVAFSTQALFAAAAAAPVLLLGYVFWKKGLEYSLLAAVLGYALYPILASLIIK